MLRTIPASLAVSLTLALAFAAPALARPFTVDDLLHQEALGDLALDPTGRWLAVERRDAYDSVGRYDLQNYIPLRANRLWIADLAHPVPARPLLPAREGRGFELGAFSPDGARLAVTKLTDTGRPLGIVERATGAVRWLDVTPEISYYGRSLQWLSPTELLVTARPDREPPWPYRIGRIFGDRYPARWAVTHAGGLSETVLGSGAYEELRPHPAPRRLLRIDVASGRVATLATGDFLDLEISPDRRHVALMEAGEDLQPKGDRPVHGDYGVETQASRLSILDLATGKRTSVCPGCDALPFLLSWSPDSRFLLAFARGPDQPWSAGSLRRIEPASGQVTSLGETLLPQLKGRPTVIRAGWMGDDPIVYARPRAEPQARLDWFRIGPDGPVNLTRGLPSVPDALTDLQPDGADLVAGGALWRTDRRGRARRLAEGVEDARGAKIRLEGRLYFAPPAEGWVLTGPKDARRLRPVAGGRLGAGLPYGEASGRVVAVSAAAQAAVVRVADPRGPERLDLVHPDSGIQPLLQINRDLAAIDASTVLPVKHPGPDGRSLVSWLFLPPRPAGAAPPPLVVRVYPGDTYPVPPAPAPPIRGFMTDVRMLLGHGYAVLTPSLPDPQGPHEPGVGLADRILAVVDAAAAAPQTRGTFDAGRMAIWGHSWGGYAVGMTLGQTDRFRAGVSFAGPFSLVEAWGSFSVYGRPMPEEEPLSFAGMFGWVEASQPAMGVPPWKDPGRYVRNSALFAADRIHTPLMIVHGDQDLHTLNNAEETFSALWRQGKDAVFVTYWGEGHLLASPGNVRDAYGRSFAFLDEHLGLKAAAAGPPRSPGAGPASGAPTPPPPPH